MFIFKHNSLILQFSACKVMLKIPKDLIWLFRVIFIKQWNKSNAVNFFNKEMWSTIKICNGAMALQIGQF